MQEFLVIVFIVASLAYLVWFVKSRYFSKKEKCDGCAMKKAFETKETR